MRSLPWKAKSWIKNESKESSGDELMYKKKEGSDGLSVLSYFVNSMNYIQMYQYQPH